MEESNARRFSVFNKLEDWTRLFLRLSDIFPVVLRNPNIKSNLYNNYTIWPRKVITYGLLTAGAFWTNVKMIVTNMMLLTSLSMFFRCIYEYQEAKIRVLGMSDLTFIQLIETAVIQLQLH
jgi:hypothetical protein